MAEQKEEDVENQNDLDLIEDTIGSLGLWQILILFVMSLTRLHIAWFQNGIIFLAPKVEFICADKNITNRCSPDCSSYEYDTSEFSQTIITQWDLVCEREYLINKVVQPLILMGVLFGSLVFGYFSDRYGRKYPLIIGGLIEAVTGIATAYVPWFELFLVLKFVTGLCNGGIILIGFVINVELTGKLHRTSVGFITRVSFNLGYAVLGLFGYLIRNWHIFQVVISVSNLLFIFLVWIIPESPRWLLLVNRTDECVEILEKAAKFNKLPTSNIKEKVLCHERFIKENITKAGNFLDLIRTREMRIRTICMSVSTFFIYLIFYGIFQHIGQIGENKFLNVMIGGLIQIPANLSCIYLLEKFGRRNMLMMTGILGGIFCILIIAVPEDAHWGTIALWILGGGFNSISVCISQIYTGELFPTIIRSVGVGTVTTIGRLGSIIAPILLDFKIKPWLIPVLFGVCSLFSALCCIELPETHNKKLPETIEEVEKYKKNNFC